MIQEQIQRLRESVTTCYNTVSSKNGVIPEEVGDFTVRNLPEAIESIPTSNTKLVDLEVTANGVYLPADYDADGFSKVTARLDTSSLGKVRLPSLRVYNSLLDENGYWAAELVDVSNLTSFRESFYQCSELHILNVSNWDTSNVKTMMYAFGGCSQLQNLDVSQWDTRNVEDMGYMFTNCEQLQQFNGNNWNVGKVVEMCFMFAVNKQILHLDLNNWNVNNVKSMISMFDGCDKLQLIEVGNWQTKSIVNTQAMFRNNKSLQQLDLTNWDFSNVINITEMFFNCNTLQSIVGGRTYKDVADNNIGCFNGLKINVGTYTIYNTQLDHASLRAIINGLADMGDLERTLVIGSTLRAKLTEEDIAIATEKGWSIA